MTANPLQAHYEAKYAAGVELERTSKQYTLACVPTDGALSILDVGCGAGRNSKAMAAHGHTPGHSMFNVQSGDEQLLIWGDIMHVPDIQGPMPHVTLAMDTDPDQAGATRQRVCDMAASDRLLVAGMHLHFPACSHIVREGKGFRVVPERWQM